MGAAVAESDRNAAQDLSRLAMSLLGGTGPGQVQAKSDTPAPASATPRSAKRSTPQAGVFDLLSAAQAALDASKAQSDENAALRREINELRERILRLEQWLGNR